MTENVIDIGSAIVKGLTSATKKWTKARKAAERNYSAMSRYYKAPARDTLKDVAYEVMEAAYMEASANNTLPAAARQIMYAARRLILAQGVHDKLEANYFTQTLLPDYLEDYPAKALKWDVVFDARGHLYEPHTGVSVPLGTLAVRSYLRGVGEGVDVLLDEPPRLSAVYPTCGTKNRFHTVLFIEKEGFAPLFKQAQIAERYDLAIMSTKGVSTTAARTLIEKLSGARFLVLHDFDKAGFSIASTLSRSTRRYTFKRRPDVVDLGLRLVDVEAEKLDSELVTYQKPRNVRANLIRNGATRAEAEFLISDVSGGRGRRVELNAFTSDHLLNWLERKFAENGVKKVVPDDDVLTGAFRRAVFVNEINKQIAGAREGAQKLSEAAKVPKTLRRQIEKVLKEHPSFAWDDAITHVVANGKKRRGGVGKAS